MIPNCLRHSTRALPPSTVPCWGKTRTVAARDATRLAAAWLQSLESALQEGDVLVNPAGGFVAKRDLIVLAEIKRRDLDLAGSNLPTKLSPYPSGRNDKHYYLCSNRGRVFVPEKFATYRAARLAALRYVPADRIKSRE